MTIDLYNPDLALATRIAVILAARPQTPRTERLLAVIDFLTTNAAEFQLYPINLHGDSIYVATEFPARLQHVRRGLRYAVTRGLVTADLTDNKIQFRINPTGAAFVNKLSAEYVTEFKHALAPALAFVDSHSERAALRRIEQQSVDLVRKDLL